MESKTIPYYIDIDGFHLDETFSAENFRSATSFKPQADDIIVATYPKCGTTWMCQIVRLIQTKGIHSEMSPEEYFSCFPFLEFAGAKAAIERLKPGCIKTHLPFNRLNFSEEAKYIYVARHPRDCVVSFYHHTKFFPEYRFSNGSFDTYFDLFIKGKIDFNDYFDNLLSWYEQKHRPNILFMTYESMKSDCRRAVLKVADFLGFSVTNQQIDNIIKYSSFDLMKKEVNDIFRNFDASCSKDEGGEKALEIMDKAKQDGYKPVGDFIRKGIVGEGKLVLTQEQEEKLTARIQEKTKGSDVMSIWDN